MTKKAHTTVVNRLLARYQGERATDGTIDIVAGELLIAVESTATLEASVGHLLQMAGLRYVAVTNQESLHEALAICADTPLGVMNARGEILKSAAS